MKRLTVAKRTDRGWMGAMNMAYRVSNEDILPTLKPGDQFTARVYNGDFTLYQVSVVRNRAPVLLQGRKTLA
jgi:hypothetical protein